MLGSETERQIRLMMILRVVTVSTLLVSAFAIQVVLSPEQTLRPLFVLAAAAYGMVLAYAIADRWARGTRTFAYVQLVGDALIVTALVGMTGGLDSPMSFLYLLPIIVAAMLDYRRGGLILAAACWALYAIVVLDVNAWFPFGRLMAAAQLDTSRAYYFLLVHLVAFVAVALLGSYLAERVRTQGRELVERRVAVARLQALNENIIASIHSGLLTTDLQGRINFLNRGGVEILERPQERVEGQDVESVFGFEPGFLQEARRQLVARRRFRFERDYVAPDGRRIFLGIALSNLSDRSGAPLGSIFIFQDLTEIHALEQEMRLKERMAALGEMAAGMAHELRNPLAAMTGAVQYLKGDLKPTGERLELMDIILRESHRLDQAIRDFLMFARPGTFNPQPCDLVRLIEENLKLLNKSHEFRSIHRVQTSYPAAEVWCEVDQNRIKQVFWNLATNALKAMPSGGTLTLALETLDGSDEVAMGFEDEGIGMDDAAKRGYFQPFRSFFEEGTGLGAAIVYRLVEEHGGRIGIDSAPGHGTRVRIILPRRRAVVAPAEPASMAGGTRA
jgi:two-component system sensor histidine kinase PilS (NtrC family)